MIRILATYSFPSYGGMQSFAFRLCSALNKNGINFEFSAPYPKEELFINPIPQYLPKPDISLVNRELFWRNTQESLLDEDSNSPILVLGLELGNAIDAQLECLDTLAAKGRRIVMRVATSGDIKSNISKKKANLFKRISFIVVLNRSMEDELRSIGIRVPTKIIPVIVDATRFSPTIKTHRRTQRKKMGLPEKSWIALWSGRFHPDKRVEIVIEAWKRSEIQGNLVLVGSDESPGKGYFNSVCKLAAQEKNSIVFFEAVSEQEMPLVYSIADCVVIASEREGMCNTIAEALCCGLRVFALDIPGTRIIREMVPQAALELVQGDPVVGLSECLKTIKRDALDQEAARGVNESQQIFAEDRILKLYLELLGV